MAETETGFPRRDAHGRLVALPDLLGVALAGLVIGILILVLFDGVLAFLGFAEFGRANGWLAVILPVWLFAEEFRAWRNGTYRVLVALVAAGVAITSGLLAAGLANEWPPLASGGVAATVFTFGYALIWFHGVRWLARS
ncbi:MAG: hypothetical protein DIU79_06140 [Actinobacteria bacterium]|nr:MAG: hypothetical protein DIU79_06140 [Actinomycetota bacterium]